MANTLLDNLVAHWSLDDTLNDAHSDGPYNLTGVNSPTFTVDSPGAWTKSLRLASASSQHVYTADGAQWDVLAGTGEWSMGLWIKLQSVAGTQFLVNSWSATASNRSLALYLTGTTLRLRVDVSDSSTDVDWTSGLSTATWYCVQLWRSGDDINISVDNGTAATTSLSASASIDAWTNDFTHGTRADSPTGYYSGQTQALSVWGADIGATNRTEFYQSGTGLAYGSWSASGGSNATRAILEHLQVPHLVRPGSHTLTR